MPVFDFWKDQKKASQNHKDEKRRLEQVPVEQIVPNPNQPRKTFQDDTLDELAASIRQVGLIQPLVVRRVEGGYELVAGERRLRACKMLNMQNVPCIVQNDVFDEDSAMMALVENLQRENLHFLEEAECYQALINNYGLKQEELAARLGKSQSAVANKLRILRFSPAVKKAMLEAKMTERHARALLRIREEETQLSLIERVREKGMSVKDTEKLVDSTLNRLYDEKKAGAVPRPKIIRYFKDYRLFTNSIRQAVDQLKEAGAEVEMEQTDLENGMDIVIHVRRPSEKQ